LWQNAARQTPLEGAPVHARPGWLNGGLRLIARFDAR
jgi:hypothetical protein